MTSSDLGATGNPENDAAAMLGRYWNFGPKPSIPVDPIFIAKQMGLQVLVTKLDNGVGGMLVAKPGTPTTIYLNINDSRARQRFTCSHELGHWMRRNRGKADWAFVDKRDQLSGMGTDSGEIYANQFAAALLMPADEVNAYEGTISPEGLASIFQVSAQAMGLRLRNLWSRQR